MLGKLLKYEIKSTAKTIVPIYVVFLLIAVLNRLCFSVFPSYDLDYGNPIFNFFAMIFSTLLPIFFIIILVSCFILTFVIIIQRFYKNLMRDEGYLMWTLPVKVSSHIFAKLLIAMLWIICTSLVSLCAFAILFVNFHTLFPDIAELFSVLNYGFQEVLGITSPQIWFACLFLLFTTIMSMVSSIIMIYCCIAIGNLSSKHKIACSFLSYVVINIILQTLYTAILFIFSFIAAIANWNPSFPTMYLSILISSTVATVILAGVFYGITHFILSKKLNLE